MLASDEPTTSHYSLQIKQLENNSLQVESELEENKERARVMSEHLKSIQQELQQTQVHRMSRLR